MLGNQAEVAVSELALLCHILLMTLDEPLRDLFVAVVVVLY